MDAGAWIEALNFSVATLTAILTAVIWLCVKMTQWHQQLRDLERRMAAHEESCGARDKATQERLEWGKTQLTKLEAEQKHMLKSLERIEKMLRRDP